MYALIQGIAMIIYIIVLTFYGKISVFRAENLFFWDLLRLRSIMLLFCL